jgi:hypothetical protein
MERAMGARNLASLAAAVAIVATAPAFAQLPANVVLESSVEIAALQAQLPNDVDGRVMLRGCEQCKVQDLQLSAATTYSVNGAKSSLSELRARLVGSTDGWLTIHFDLRDRRVTRVDLVK